MHFARFGASQSDGAPERSAWSRWRKGAADAGTTSVRSGRSCRGETPPLWGLRLREVADVSQGGGTEHLTVVTAVTLAREEALWAEEVARVLGAAASFEPAARAAVLAVLQSLADDATESPATRRDVRALLDALDAGTTLGAVLSEDDARMEPHGDHRSSGLLAVLRGALLPAA